MECMTTHIVPTTLLAALQHTQAAPAFVGEGWFGMSMLGMTLLQADILDCVACELSLTH